jgi:hypothetical protein
MKIEPKCNPNPKPIYPLIFKKFCRKCKMYFVREPGWKYEYINHPGIQMCKYICKSCASTQIEAYDF